MPINPPITAPYIAIPPSFIKKILEMFFIIEQVIHIF